MTKPRIGYVTAMWKRPELTDMVFSHVAFLKEKLADKLELIPAVAGSEGDVSRAIAERNGFLYAEAPNSPLSNKWNASLALLREQDVDGVCIFGSDDLPNETYFLRLLEELSRGRDLLGVDGMYFFDQFTGRMFDWKGYRAPREKDVPGAGRFLHRRYIERLNWRLWPDGLESCLDNAMFQRLRAHCGQDLYFYQLRHEEERIAVVDVKSQTFMSSIESLAAAGPMTIIGNPYAFLEQHFDSALVAKLFLPQTPRLTEEDLPVSEIWKNSAPHGKRTDTEGNIFCVAHPALLGSLAHDALFAFQQMGRTVRTLTPQEFLMREPQKNDILYVQPVDCYNSQDLFTLLCASHRLYRVVADCRGLPDGPLLQRLYALPIALIGAPARTGVPATVLPLPFSVPARPLPFVLRGNIMASLLPSALMEEVASSYVASQLHARHVNLFFGTDEGTPTNALLQKTGIFFYSQWRCFSLRQLFQVSLSCGRRPGPEFFLSLAGGTPAVCVGRAPDGLRPEQGVFETKNLTEAMSLLKLLTSNAACWQQASDRALAFARAGQAAFAAQFGKLFP
ncbi:hypothetical protein [uncultured Desulfovibrio sp.]|uniref:hypothetical protein n=1 Tax=uncultured Desulfovibrio sp. TaxID=167968 RepID=UPI0026175882|nr:hypothetical protein [uncultured Desulfovibrio sp.]